jgi:hypothetical protein
MLGAWIPIFRMKLCNSRTGRHDAVLQRGRSAIVPGVVAVAAIDPVASLQAIANPALQQAAQEVRAAVGIGHRLSWSKPDGVTQGR